MSTYPNDDSEKSRLFFAIWPHEQLQTQLLQWQRIIATTGNQVPRERLHVTLAFLGDTPKETALRLIKGAAEVKHPTFEFTLDHVGYFNRPQILWLGPSDPSSSLLLLQEKLTSVIEACGLEPPAEQFKPHVTLARKAQKPTEVERVPSLNWRVDRFYLVESRVTQNGPEYRVIEEFMLKEADGAK